jgi:hypothetical protein
MATLYNLEKDKNLIYKEVRQRIISSRPELLHKLTSKKFAEAMLVLRGFLSCFQIMAEEPIREKEIKDLLLAELVNYICDEQTRKPEVHQVHQGSH